MNFRELNAPQLVSRWKSLVNDHVQVGRDAHLLKDFLLRANSVQILLGMYRMRGQSTITIPQFLRQNEAWLEEDEYLAEIELARYISKITPPEYYTYRDLMDEESTFAFKNSFEARQSLKEWSDRILA